MTSKIYVFTYGSLLNLASLRRTIGRSLDASELVPARLHAHRVCWGYSTPVHFENEESGEIGVFLTLVHDASSECIGAIFGVSEEEFENLKKRERGYEILEFRPSDFTCVGFNMEVKIYAFGTRSLQRVQGVIPRKYIEMLTLAINNFDDKFREEYRAKVLDHLPFATKKGEYTFINKQQNAYAKGEI